MPSSSIPRSISDPNISKTRHFDHLPPSDQSSCSSHSSKFTFWPKKVGKIITITRKSESSKHSDLTEESLEAFNKQIAIADEKKNTNPSPYYKGLTDSSLVLNRQRVSGSSPGRESHATTVATSSSISTFIVKIQEWTSCFSSKSKGDSINNNHATSGGKKQASSSSSSSRTGATAVKEMGFETKKEVSGSLVESSNTLANKEKPLRERVSEPSPPALTVPTERVVLKEDKTKTKNADASVFVWADKYRPKALTNFICNRDKALQLRGFATAEEYCSHFIFEGPPGVGKRTMIWALLREAYGPDRIQTREECKEFDLKGESVSSIQVNVKESSQHVEVNLSELKGYEKQVIVELIKETHNRISSKALQCNHDNCRAIILYEADKLSTDALLYIRWLLERYRGCNKVFFCCSDVSKLQPIKTICTVVQLFPPSSEEIIEVLEFIAKQEGIELPHRLAKTIADNSKNNLRQAIRSFEASWQFNYPLKEDQVIMTGWEDDIANIAKNIVEEQSPKQLYIIRGKLQNLIEHNVSPDFLFKTLVGELKKHLDEELQIQVDCLYDEYNNRDGGSMIDGEKPFAFAHNQPKEMGKRLNEPGRKNVHHFMRIEEFIAKFMSQYKYSIMNNKGEHNYTL